jgi:hypothetical protein
MEKDGQLWLTARQVTAEAAMMAAESQLQELKAVRGNLHAHVETAWQLYCRASDAAKQAEAALSQAEAVVELARRAYAKAMDE